MSRLSGRRATVPGRKSVSLLTRSVRRSGAGCSVTTFWAMAVASSWLTCCCSACIPAVRFTSWSACARNCCWAASAAADAAQQQLRAQADQEVKRTAGIQALQQHVSQELATAIAQKVVTLQPAPDRLTLRVRSETLFRPGTVALRPESRDILEQIAAVLHTVPDYLYRVDSHTDNAPMTGAARERFPSHWEFSAVRAVTLGRFFQERHIPAERLVVSGHAFYRPLAPNTTPEGRAQNRRIEISLVPLPVPENGHSADTNGRHSQ